ncbi:MAG: T9SS type A sorting domain-containing protein [Bacteroidetes bacterium]|nr:T9SS type A sorting domain-containing protein [Bacteroidota bacterium]
MSYIDWPPLWGVPQHTVTALCKQAGTHCCVYVEVNVPAPSQESIDTLVQRFENHFYPELTYRYGPVPQFFGLDSMVYILALAESNWGGYFDPGQGLPDSLVFNHWNRHSSGKNLIYIAADYFDYSAPSIVSHEFGHLLHWGQDHSPEPPVDPVKYWEDTWVDEGFSTFAAIYLTTNIFQQGVLDYGTFFATDPDIPLIWFSNYNQVELFMLFMFEHYGQWDYISALISNQLNGIAGVDSTLHLLGYTQHFDDVFEQWIIANYLDDTQFENGKYGYDHYNFSNCHVTATYSSFPTGNRTGTISAYAADYITFQASASKPLTIDFHGDTGKKYRLAFIKMNTSSNEIKGISFVTPDIFSSAVFDADSLGTDYNRLVMVVMNVDSSVHEGEVAGYTYAASVQNGIPDESADDQLVVFPNPVSDFLSVHFPDNDHLVTEICIYNDLGELVYQGNHSCNANKINVLRLKNGIYFMKTPTGGVKFVKE